MVATVVTPLYEQHVVSVILRLRRRQLLTLGMNGTVTTRRKASRRSATPKIRSPGEPFIISHCDGNSLKPGDDRRVQQKASRSTTPLKTNLTRH